MTENEFDQILDEMRGEAASAETEAAAKERVWRQISGGPLCAQFRGQFAGYRAGELAEAQRLLLEDHLTRCAGCRREFNAAKVIEMPVAAAPVRRRFAMPKWAMAAGVAAVGLFLGRGVLDRAMAPAGPRATVESATAGGLMALAAATLDNGAAIGDGEVVRTAAGARAQLRLADGSMVEVNERTELSVRSAWSGSTIHLDRGDIIVRAAKQRNGYLKVVTRDSEAAVKGTIFTVSAGTAGSLVGVVEGAVAVKQPGTDRVLQPGEQASTTPALAKVTVKEAVSWSKEREAHFAVLAELAAIEKQLKAPAPRTAGKIVTLLPPDVEVYAAVPNLGPTMNEAVELIEQRSGANAALREWWASKSAGEMKMLLEKMNVLSPLLGEEVVFMLVKPHTPVVMAEVKAGKEAALTAELKKLLPAEAAFQAANGLLVISKSAGDVETILRTAGTGTGSAFGQELARRYGRGVAWLLGVDVQAMGTPGAPAALGTNQVKYAFVEQRTVQGVEENEATMTFAGPRKGIASWLAAPGSLGSAEYATADALLVLAAATRNPRQILEETAGLIPGFGEALREMEMKSGVNVANDLAAALGTDFTVSLETATVPIPGVVIAAEVYQPATLNATIARLVEVYNREALEGRKLTLAQETVEGRVWHSLLLNGFGLRWTFDRGYWIVSTDRAVALRALATRAGGTTLVRSEKFRAQIPTLGGLHPSGFAWFNLGSAADMVSSFASEPQLKKFLTIREASLVTFNGETERIQVASRTRLTSLMLDTMLSSQAGGKRGR